MEHLCPQGKPLQKPQKIPVSLSAAPAQGGKAPAVSSPPKGASSGGCACSCALHPSLATASFLRSSPCCLLYPPAFPTPLLSCFGGECTGHTFRCRIVHRPQPGEDPRCRLSLGVAPSSSVQTVLRSGLLNPCPDVPPGTRWRGTGYPPGFGFLPCALSLYTQQAGLCTVREDVLLGKHSFKMLYSSKKLSMREIIDKLDFIKIKSVCSAKSMSGE